MNIESEIFSRTRLLLGQDAMTRLANTKVLVFGVGGVGSWCAEALIRTGVGHLTIVDSDCVSVSNINRQLMATTATVGKVKVDALRRHLLLINPEADITAIRDIFCEETLCRFDLDDYDYVVDCIDSLKNKALLIETATRSKARFFASMGAALKLDPTKIKVAEFRSVKGCPLARALRNRFKRTGRFPPKKFLCVYSDELLQNQGAETPTHTNKGHNTASLRPNEPEPIAITAVSNEPEHIAITAVSNEPTEMKDNNWDARKAQINGSLMPVTSIFGITLAGLIVKDITTH